MITAFVKGLFRRNSLVLDIRLARAGDSSFIFDSMLVGVESGHFNSGYGNPASHPALRWQIDAAIAGTGVPMADSSRDGVGARVFVLECGGERLGFAMVLENTPGSWNKCIELFAIAVSSSHRRKGIARAFLRWVLANAKSKKVYARCFPRSSAMRELLADQGFAKVSTTAKGTTLFEKVLKST